MEASPGVFISHTHADKPFARRIAADLWAAGARVWIDEAEIKLGDSLIDKIRDGIDSMDYLAVVLSPASVKSEWVKREVDVAMNQEINGRTVRVLPLLHKKCPLPWFLEGKMYADFTDEAKYSDALLVVLDRLNLKPAEPIRPTTVKTGDTVNDIANSFEYETGAVFDDLCRAIDKLNASRSEDDAIHAWLGTRHAMAQYYDSISFSPVGTAQQAQILGAISLVEALLSDLGEKESSDAIFGHMKIDTQNYVSMLRDCLVHGPEEAARRRVPSLE